ncbi:jg4713, partial [Pararge aegeria aegeria]
MSISQLYLSCSYRTSTECLSMNIEKMSEGGRTLVDKSESSSFEDLASAAAHEIEEAKLAEAAAAEKTHGEHDKPADEWQDMLGSGALLKKFIKSGDESNGSRPQRSDICRISYELKLRDGTQNIVEKRDHVKIYLGDNE